MGYIVDIVVMVFLLLTTAFCWRLNKQILELKRYKGDFTDLVKVFDNAIVSTHKSILALKEASSTASTDVKFYVDKSEELLNDLSFMTDMAAKLADKLESAISAARKQEVAIRQIHFEVINKNSIEDLVDKKADVVAEIKRRKKEVS